MTPRRTLAVLARLLAVVAGLAGLGGVIVASNAGSDPAVVAFPRPGTVTSMADGQLSFRGVDAERLSDLRVTGTESGEHTGEVIEHAGGAGASFVPDEGFVPGEQVSVVPGFEVRGAGGGEGYRITVARPPPPPPDDDGDGDDDEEEEPVEPQSFVSRPDLRPPYLDVEVDRTGGGDDPVMFSIGRFSRVPTGNYVMDDTGEPVYVHHTREAIQHPHVVELGGEPVLIWWEGEAHQGWGQGVWKAVGQDYEPRGELAAVGSPADFHEVLVSERGGAETAIFLLYVPLEWDLSGVGGPERGTVLETVVQEVEIESGAVVFEWHSLDHVDVSESTEPAEGASLDHFHGNSVELDGEDGLLVSARNTSATYRIDRHDGDVDWQLGGEESDFRFEDPLGFEFQHDVRRRDDGTISVFDNGADREGRDFSRVLVLELDEAGAVAETVEVIEHDPPVFGEFTGNARWHDDGSVFVSWGSSGRFSEYGRDGELILDGRIRGETVYRLLRTPWEGRPTTDPDLALRPAAFATEFFVSWNGATEVERWRLLASDQPVAEVARDGFETSGALAVGCELGPVRAVALDAAGTALGESDPVQVPGC